MRSPQLGPAGRARVWFTLTVLASLVPVTGAFSLTRVFFVRDLGLFFWPRHLSLLAAWKAGEWPLWNPYVGAGQSAVADPLNQFFLLPVTLIRLLLPPVVGFNFWVAAPLPVLAIGAWLWLRRHASQFGAFVGAVLFVAAGPVASTADFPNFSWSVALIPWALWATNRLCERPRAVAMAVLALIVALQAVAGEAVSFAATCALILATALVVAPGERGVARARCIAWVMVAVVTGVLLSSVQTVPLLTAARHSSRAGQFENDYWSAHPVALLETVTGHLFGHGYTEAEGQPWLRGLNDGREPLLYSLYIGLGALLLASVARSDGKDRRWRWFWGGVAFTAVVCGMGAYTPIYPALERVVPLLRSFRFPVKYLVFSVVGVAALAATGSDTLRAHVAGDCRMKRPTLGFLMLVAAAVVGALFAGGNLLAPAAMTRMWEALARYLDVPTPPAAARWILGASTPHWLRLIGLGAGGSVLMLTTWSRERLARFAMYAFCVLAMVDPLLLNLDLNPTIPARELGPPEWLQGIPAAHRSDRIYIGGFVEPPRHFRLEKVHPTDGLSSYVLPVEVTQQEGAARHWADFAFTPAAWGIRQMISYDLPKLWPKEYRAMIDRFRQVPKEDRFRFLARTGVRYCFLPEPPTGSAQKLALVSVYSAPMALYECASNPRRAYVTESASVEPSWKRQLELMFDEHHDPAREVMLDDDAPPASGIRRRAAAITSAEIVEEGSNQLSVRASTGPGGGYLNLLDSYDPDWSVEVDGEPAALLRANVLFRAVRLSAGTHDVRFTYHPRALYLGTAVTGATGVAVLIPLLGLARFRRRNQVASSSPIDALPEY